MTIPPVVIGIDISKHHLDVFDPALGRVERFTNDRLTVAEFAKRFAKVSSFVVFEATGHYDACLRQALVAKAVAYSRVNPARARDFARAAGFLAKTDAVDARMLANMGQSLRLHPEPPCDPDRQRLALLSRRRDQLVATRQQERIRRRQYTDAAIAASIDAHLAWLDNDIATLDAAITDLIKVKPRLQSIFRLLRSVPGVGPVTATTLIALAPELGSRSPKTIAALAGLAPINADSGQFRGKRAIRGGRKRLRDALYVAAVVASRSRSRFANFYRNLRDAGKHQNKPSSHSPESSSSHSMPSFEIRSHFMPKQTQQYSCPPRSRLLPPSPTKNPNTGKPVFGAGMSGVRGKARDSS